jgi:signal transduction histidine kinase
VLSSFLGEVVAALALAITIVALATLLQRARSERGEAERTIAFEREIASDLLAQADALDRLVAAAAGLADDLDEQRVLDRLASATRSLLEADAALVVELDANGHVACVAHNSVDPSLVPPPLPPVGDTAETLHGALGDSVRSIAMAALGPSADLVVIRRDDPQFSPLELAQVRVLADFGSRARQNARLFTLARSLRAQAEERERERARLSDRLLTAEEQERRRLSLALHDGPQQTVAGVGLILETALADLGAEEHDEAGRMLRLAIDRTRGVVRDLRRLTFSLEPITLRDHGFGAAFGELAAQTGDAHRIAVTVNAAIVDQLERPIQVCLYRIAQEALANAVKHAGASSVEVRARKRNDGTIEFAIADDGGGTSPAQLDRRGHHQGVDAMRERASGIGAHLRFEQTPGGGTTVRVIVPSQAETLPAAA